MHNHLTEMSDQTEKIKINGNKQYICILCNVVTSLFQLLIKYRK